MERGSQEKFVVSRSTIKSDRKKLEEITAGEKDATNRLELMKKLLTKQKLEQDQEATEKRHTEKVVYKREKIKLELEYQQQLSTTKQSNPGHQSTFSQGILKMPKLVISTFLGTPRIGCDSGGNLRHKSTKLTRQQ